MTTQHLCCLPPLAAPPTVCTASPLNNESDTRKFSTIRLIWLRLESPLSTHEAMRCCLNPDCSQPINDDPHQFCQHCGVPLISRLRNRFRIVKPLGRGGFGKTYLAEDTEKFNEACVVKQLAYRGSNNAAMVQKVRELFEREAKQLQKLGEHPQIPGLLAYFEENTYLYLVQQWVNGQTLQAELTEQGPFSDAKIRVVLQELLPILQFVHQNGIVHRDLKPENIIRSQDNQKLVLIDFGVSKVLSTSVQTTAGTMLGSQGYSPLEQILEGKASPASDLFSLGATCFHLMSNIAPHQLLGESGYQWSQHWQQYLPRGFQPRTIAILNKLLQLDLAQRYQTCEQVLADLTPTEIASTQAIQPLPTDPSAHETSPHPNEPIHKSISAPFARSWKVILGGIAIASCIGVPLVWTLTHPPKTTTPTASEQENAELVSSSQNQLEKIEPIPLPRPNFQRSPLIADSGAPKLNQVSAEPNLITDTKAWFQEHQLVLPVYTVPNPARNELGNLPSGINATIGNDIIVQAIQSKDHLLLLYGPDYAGGTHLYGYDEARQKYLYGFDFSNYTLAPENDPADLDFVEQRVHWAEQEENILYVSHGHRTYARSSKGMNAYLTAIDLTTQTTLWTSQPLVSNANNFLLLDKYIVSGYGFTDEPDFIYLLEKSSGAVVKSIPLDTAPEYIFRKGDRLLVRGYNTNYEFQRRPPRRKP